MLASSWFDVSLSTPAAEPGVIDSTQFLGWPEKPHCWEVLVTSIHAQEIHSNMSCIMCWWEICTDGLFDYLLYSSLIYHQPHRFSSCQEVWLSNICRYQVLCQIGWIIGTASCNYVRWYTLLSQANSFHQQCLLMGFRLSLHKTHC